MGVFGETKHFLMARNTLSCIRQVGATNARYYIFRGTVVRPGEAGMYEGLVDMCHKICDVVDGKNQMHFSHMKSNFSKIILRAGLAPVSLGFHRINSFR